MRKRIELNIQFMQPSYFDPSYDVLEMMLDTLEL